VEQQHLNSHSLSSSDTTVRGAAHLLRATAQGSSAQIRWCGTGRRHRAARRRRICLQLAPRRPIYLQRAPRRPNPMAVRPSSSLVAGSSDAGSTVSKAVAAGSTASNATVAPPGGSGSWAGYGPSMGSERAYRWAFGFFLFFKSIYRDGHCNAPTCIDLLTEAVILKRPPWLIY
jgi:hypothetical protein